MTKAGEKQSKNRVPEHVKAVVKGLMDGGMTHNEIAALPQQLPTSPNTLTKIKKNYDADKEIADFFTQHKKQLLSLDVIADREITNLARTELEKQIGSMKISELLGVYRVGRINEGIGLDKLAKEENEGMGSSGLIYKFALEVRKRDARE